MDDEGGMMHGDMGDRGREHMGEPGMGDTGMGEMGKGDMAMEHHPAESMAQPMTGKIPQAEQFIGLGALLIVFVDILGDIILQEYFVNTLGWVAAIGAVLAIWGVRLRGMKTPVSYGWIVAVLGFAALIGGVRELIDDLVYGVLDDGTDVILGLISYAGAALMGLGAYRSVKTG